MSLAINKILIYAKDMQRTSEFYERHFGFNSKADDDGRIIELTSASGGANLLIHQAGKGVKLGQVGIKLVFDVKDVEAYKKKCAKLGLKFGSTHQAEGYSYANAKDPDKNSISISSRAFRKSA
ncbi:MAG: VOC family protein [Anaerolineales bacterium]|nr:VOC family protein [Anaerolineales bacterium]